MELATTLSKEFITLEEQNSILSLWKEGEIHLNSLSDGNLISKLKTKGKVAGFWIMKENKLLVLYEDGCATIYSLKDLSEICKYDLG